MVKDNPTRDRWPTVTAEQLALLYLRDCEQQIRQSINEPIRLAQAAKSIHHSLQAALTAVLAGGMGIGAYGEKLEQKWLAFLQDGASPPGSDRVMCLESLLKKATEQKLEWTGQPLPLSEQEAAQLQKLDWVRDRLEHARPGFWVIEPAYLYAQLSTAARVTLRSLHAVQHHFEQNELDHADRIVQAIEDLCEAQKG